MPPLTPRSGQATRKAKESRMVRTKGSMVLGAVRDQIDFLKRASRQNAWGMKVKQRESVDVII